jgi:hypothetical protein
MSQYTATAHLLLLSFSLFAARDQEHLSHPYHHRRFHRDSAYHHRRCHRGQRYLFVE